MSFFDSEAVGDLTSRISSDCQRLSRTLGNDIHLILRNILQVTTNLAHSKLLITSLILVFSIDLYFSGFRCFCQLNDFVVAPSIVITDHMLYFICDFCYLWPVSVDILLSMLNFITHDSLLVRLYDFAVNNI